MIRDEVITTEEFGFGGGTFYVNADTGSDGYDGTESEPFATIDKALSVIGPIVRTDSTIYIQAKADESSYDTTKLFEPRQYQARLTIIGVGSIYESDELTLDSYTTNGIFYTFTGVTLPEDGYMGMHLEIIDEAGFEDGQFVTIVTNTADTISAVSPIYNSSWAVPTAGATFRISRPGVSINVDQDVSMYGGSFSSKDPLFPKGDVLYEGLRLENIEFKTPNDTYISMELLGRFFMYGCTFTKSGDVDFYIKLNSASIASGTTYDVPKEWGASISGYDRDADHKHPRIQARNSQYSGMWVGGYFEYADSSSGAIVGSNRYSSMGYPLSFPHGCLYIGKNCYVYTLDSGNYRMFFDNYERAIEVEFGMMELYLPSVLNSDGAFVRARHQGQFHIAKPIVTSNGSSNKSLSAWEGGRIRITGNDGSTLGDAVAGVNTSITRPSTDGAWAIGEQIVSADLSIIKRTS